MHSWTGHGQRVTPETLTASSFRAVDRPGGSSAWSGRVGERDLLRYSDDTLLMKKLTLLGALALFATSIGAQSPVTDDPKMVEALLKEVQAQQHRDRRQPGEDRRETGRSGRSDPDRPNLWQPGGTLK